ncbi:EFR1 family ferrodoxin [Lachnospiraceae bacterium 45-W7]
MSVYRLIFSPTGGTKRVAELFTKAFCSNSTYVDLASRNENFSSFSFHEQDICIVAVPSYGGRVPAAAVSRLQQMKGNNAKAILIVAYGNRAYDDTFTELQDTLTDCGFSCAAAIAAIAEHSIMHQFASGRPDAEDEKELASFAETIRSKIEAGAVSNRLTLPGNRPYLEYNGVPMKPQTDKSCTECGLCARECPVGAINCAKPPETDNQTCISCMRCIAICPQKARSISKTLLAAGSMKMKKSCSDYKKNELFV